MEVNVCKFGGTSMADADAIRQSAEVARDNDASIVVVSATGGTTDQLIELATSKDAEEREAIVNEIADRHFEIASELSAPENVINEIGTLCTKLRVMSQNTRVDDDVDPKTLDSFTSMGEQFSSRLMVVAMDEYDGPTAQYLDAREIIKTDDHYGQAEPDIATIIENADRLIRPSLGEIAFITQGFIGEAPDGNTTTLGRGGSDYSAALFAEAANASQLQIWTDVPGMATTDPRIVKDARPIPEISFQEAAELATSGAKILHPPTVIPARRAGVSVFIGSTFKPEAGGTIIKERVEEMPLVRAISILENQSLLTISTPKMSQQHGFLADVFRVIADQRISIDQITTSEVSVSFTLDHNEEMNNKLVASLQEFAAVDVDTGLAVVTLIGNEVNHTPGLSKRIFESIQNGHDDMAVRAIFQGASKHSVSFIVSDEHGETAVKRLHKTFLEDSA